MRKLLTLLVCLGVLSGATLAQQGQSVAQEEGAGLSFARLEVRASWQEKGETKYETRTYYSGFVQLDPRDLRTKENLVTYFNDGVVAPAATRGIKLDYYDSDVTLYPASYSYDTEQEGLAEMAARQDSDKSNEFSLYSFTWNYNGKAAGEATTAPKRIWAKKPAPAKEKAPAKAP